MTVQLLRSRQADRLALAGGAPVRAEPLPPWPPAASSALSDAVVSCLQGNALQLRGPRLTGDDEKQAFEQAFARYTGCPFAIAVNSGTSAIDLAFQALQLPDGGAVVAANYGHPSTIRAAAERHSLRLVDIDAETLGLSVCELAVSLQTDSIRCVLLTHVGGNLGHVEAVRALCKEAEVPLIEDASHAHGARAGGKAAGTFGTAGCFSLHATKNLAVGEGGIITCSDADTRRRILRAHDIGRDAGSTPYDFVSLGGNYRLSEIASLIGRHRLEELDDQNARRLRNVTRLRNALPTDSPLLLLPGPAEADVHSYHFVAARYRPDACRGMSRHRFILALCAEGIVSNAGWPSTLSTVAARHARVEPHETPEAERAIRELVWLDQRLFLTDEGAQQVVEAVGKIQRCAHTIKSGK
jgi:3-amino-5-hydroxybenzoate synthase